MPFSVCHKTVTVERESKSPHGESWPGYSQAYSHFAHSPLVACEVFHVLKINSYSSHVSLAKYESRLVEPSSCEIGSSLQVT